LRKHLDRWVAEGLIDTAQATRIETAETPAATGSRAPLAGVVLLGSAVWLARGRAGSR